MDAHSRWSRCVTDLYRAHYDRLVHETRRLVGGTGTAEDLVQDAFVRLLSAPPRQPDKALAWLRTVTRHLAIDWLRRDGRSLPEDPASRLVEPSAEERALRRVDGEAARAALVQLDPRARRAVLLRQDGASYRDIAKALAMPETQVGVLLWRSLHKLAKALEEPSPPREKGALHASHRHLS